MTPSESVREIAEDTNHGLDALTERMAADHAELMATINDLEAVRAERGEPVAGDD